LVGDIVGDPVKQFLLHTDGQKKLTGSPAPGCPVVCGLSHRSSVFSAAAQSQSFDGSPLNSKVVLSWHSPRSVGESVGALVGESPTKAPSQVPTIPVLACSEHTKRKICKKDKDNRCTWKGKKEIKCFAKNCSDLGTKEGCQKWGCKWIVSNVKCVIP